MDNYKISLFFVFLTVFKLCSFEVRALDGIVCAALKKIEIVFLVDLLDYCSCENYTK